MSVKKIRKLDTEKRKEQGRGAMMMDEGKDGRMDEEMPGMETDSLFSGGMGE